MIFTKLSTLQGPCPPLNYKLLIGVSLLLIGIAEPVFSGYVESKDTQPPSDQHITTGIHAYVPPVDSQPPRGQTVSGGRRGGCENITNLDLIALAPQQHVGQTVSTQPTLTWFVPDETTYPIKLQIHEHDGDDWVDVVEDYDIGSSQYGYMSYTIPANIELEVGGFYSWRVVLMCASDRQSSTQVTGAEFEVVERPAELEPVESTRIQQAKQFIAAGLWYDAMELLSNSSLSLEEIAYRSQLLIDLAEFENEEVSTQLRLIAETD